MCDILIKDWNEESIKDFEQNMNDKFWFRESNL